MSLFLSGNFSRKLCRYELACQWHQILPFCILSAQKCTANNFIRESHVHRFAMEEVYKKEIDGPYKGWRYFKIVMLCFLLNISLLPVHLFCRCAVLNAFIVRRAPYKVILMMHYSFGRSVRFLISQSGVECSCEHYWGHRACIVLSQLCEKWQCCCTSYPHGPGAGVVSKRNQRCCYKSLFLVAEFIEYSPLLT